MIVGTMSATPNMLSEDALAYWTARVLADGGTYCFSHGFSYSGCYDEHCSYPDLSPYRDAAIALLREARPAQRRRK